MITVCLLQIFIIQSCRLCRTVFQCQIIRKQQKISSTAKKYYPCSGKFDNDNKTYLPTRMTALGYEEMECHNMKSDHTTLLCSLTRSYIVRCPTFTILLFLCWNHLILQWTIPMSEKEQSIVQFLGVIRTNSRG